MKNKENFLKVYHRLKEVTEKINSDKDINQNFKYGFNHCMALIKNHTYEFESINLLLENDQLKKDILDKESQIRSLKSRVTILLDNIKKNKVEDLTFEEHLLNISGLNIKFESNIPKDDLLAVQDKLIEHVLIGVKKTPNAIRYKNKSINFLQAMGYRCI